MMCGTCGYFEKYQLGQIDSAHFQAHAGECPTCRRLEQQDRQLMSLAGSLKEPVKTPGLWDKIEKDLTDEIKKDNTPTPPRSKPVSFPFLLAAAMLLLAAAAGSFITLYLLRSPGPLLSDNALAQVEQTEQQYIAAISQLEERALPRLANLDLQLMMLYRDRLETIDRQIKRCREAVSLNPGNNHIRRYMLAALQDKQQTLRELANSNTVGGVPKAPKKKNRT